MNRFARAVAETAMLRLEQHNCESEMKLITTYEIAYSLREDYPEMINDEVNELSENIYSLICEKYP